MQAFTSPKELEDWVEAVMESQDQGLGAFCFQSVIDGWYFLVMYDASGPHPIARHTGPFFEPNMRPLDVLC